MAGAADRRRVGRRVGVRCIGPHGHVNRYGRRIPVCLVDQAVAARTAGRRRFPAIGPAILPGRVLRGRRRRWRGSSRGRSLRRTRSAHREAPPRHPRWCARRARSRNRGSRPRRSARTRWHSRGPSGRSARGQPALDDMAAQSPDDRASPSARPASASITLRNESPARILGRESSIRPRPCLFVDPGEIGGLHLSAALAEGRPSASRRTAPGVCVFAHPYATDTTLRRASAV